jgi:HEAT repeat protein
MFKLPPLDLFSFGLGFVIALLVVWLISRFKPLFLALRKAQQEKKEILVPKLGKPSGVENNLRKEIINIAQKMHIASNIFSLDEVLIPPRVIVPPSKIEGIEQITVETSASLYIPYLPDAVELYSEFPQNTLTLAEALQNRENIILVGRPGYGKTVALAHLASQISRQDPATGILSNFIPLFIHVADLLNTLTNDDNQDPLDNLIKITQSRFSMMLQGQLPGFILKALEEKRLILLLDGLDEISPEMLTRANQFLTSLTSKHPNLLVVTTGSPDFLDGLVQLGFHPVSIAPWGINARKQLMGKWLTLWSHNLAPDIIKNNGIEMMNHRLLYNWLASEKGTFSPLEWTLKIWMAITGEGGKNGSGGIIEAFIQRIVQNTTTRQAFGYYAIDLCKNLQISRQFGQIESFLSRFSLPAEVPAESLSGTSGKTEKGKDQKVSSAGSAINSLLEHGIFVEHGNGEICFANPAFFGTIAGVAVEASPPPELISNITWSVAQECLHYSVSNNPNPQWIVQLLQTDEEPFYRNLLNISHWLKDAPANASWKPIVMKRLFSLMSRPEQSFCFRFQLLAGIASSGDPNTSLVYKQLLTTALPVLRQLAVVGLGLTQDPGNLDDLLNALGDEDESVRVCACLAIGAIPGPDITKVLVDILMNGEENIRLAAAQLLSIKSPDGVNLLREALTVDDILTRRAAVIGLSMIRDASSLNMMEKIAIEDAQWVVRNAASQAIEHMTKPNPNIPQKLVQPQEAPWLIAFASSKGLGLRPDQPATDMLLLAAKSGSEEERLAALRYLRLEPSSTNVLEIYRLLSGNNQSINHAASIALWYLAASGAKMPSLTKYGLT